MHRYFKAPHAARIDIGVRGEHRRGMAMLVAVFTGKSREERARRRLYLRGVIPDKPDDFTWHK